MEKKSMFLNGKRISYLEEGGVHAPPVLLLHGVPESSLVWREIIPVIVASGFRAIAPDLPGFGSSERFNEPSTWERYQRFLSDFAAELKLEGFHLVVHDWGGLIGLGWACENPGKIQSLIITDTTISMDYSWHKLAQIWRTPGMGEEAMKRMSDWNQFREAMKQSMPVADDDTLKDFFQVFRSPESSEAVLELYRSGNGDKIRTYTEKMSSIQQPVTIIWGEKDSYVPVEFAYKLQKESFPHAKVHVIANAGHFIQLEVPDEVNIHIEQHFKSL